MAAVALVLAACTEGSPTRVASPDAAGSRAEFARRRATPGARFFMTEAPPAPRPASDNRLAFLIAPPTGYIDAVVNGGFESGFAGWTRTAIGFGFGDYRPDPPLAQPGLAWMVGASDGRSYGEPPDAMTHEEPLAHSGDAGASATENGPTLATIYQDVSIIDDGTARPVTLRLWLRWKNQNGSWDRGEPACSSETNDTLTTVPFCQDIVVQLRNPGANRLLTELWSASTTNAPLFSGGGNISTAYYVPLEFDLTAYKGQTVRLQLENRVCCFTQFLDIDDVQVMVPIIDTPPLTTTQAVPSTTGTVNTLIPTFTPVTAAGGTVPYTFALSGGALPTGMSFSTSTGAVSGTPTTTLVATDFTVTATDHVGAKSSQTFTLTVNDALTTTQAVPSTTGTQGTLIPTVTPVAAAGGTLPYTFALSGGTLPTGMSFSTSTGAVSGTPTTTLAATDFTVTATDNVGATSSQTFTLTVNDALTTTQAVPSTTGTVNTLIPTFTPVTAAGGTLPYTFALSGGTLPTGMSFSTSTGAVSGTPTTTLAATVFTVTVTDEAGATSTKTFTLRTRP